MALIVETGAGLSTAESYCSVADATAYHASRGNAAWANLASDTVREQKLRIATDFLEQVYREQWAGYRVSVTQALSWPRAEVPMKDAPSGYGSFPAYYPNNAVPQLVVRACAEMALKAIAGDLVTDQGPQVKSETVGPLSVTYADGSRQGTAYAAVGMLLAPLLSGGAGVTRLVRA